METSVSDPLIARSVELSSCINCGEPVQARYCSSCGQQNPPKKLTFLTLYHDFQNRIYGLDGMFPRTMKDLTIAPGKVSQTYITGNRVKYVAPVGYYFLALTFFLLFMELLGLSLADLSNPYQAGQGSQGGSAGQQFLTEKIMGIFSDNMRLFSFAMIPINALIAWMFFRKEKMNILEHSVLIFYTSGHVMWFSIIVLFVLKFTGINLNPVQPLLALVLYCMGTVSLYKKSSSFARIVKGVLVFALTYVVYIVMFMIATIIYLISNPAFMEQFKKANG